MGNLILSHIKFYLDKSYDYIHVTLFVICCHEEKMREETWNRELSLCWMPIVRV